MAEKKKKTHFGKKRRGMSIPSILALAVLTYIIVNVAVSGGGRLRTTVVYKGEEEELFSAVGYVFRDQTVINASESGYVYCEVPENERVKAGETVISLYKTELDPRADSVLGALEEKIEKLSENRIKESVYGSDSERIEQSIAEEIRKLHSYVREGSINMTAEQHTRINELIEKKRIANGETERTESDDELESLKAQRDSIIKENNVEKTAVSAPAAGAFTARVDGMEELLSLEHLENIDRAYLKELDKAKAELKNGSYAEAGEPIGKIVNNFTWSVAAIADKSDIEFMNEGQELEIRFVDSGAETVKAVVSKITDMDSDSAVIVVSSNRYTDTVYSTSKAELEFIKHSYSGLKIPSESIRIVDDQKGVFVIRNDEARFVPVKIRYSNADWAIVAEETEGTNRLKLYDELIIEGKNLYDGKDVR